MAIIERHLKESLKMASRMGKVKRKQKYLPLIDWF